MSLALPSSVMDPVSSPETTLTPVEPIVAPFAVVLAPLAVLGGLPGMEILQPAAITLLGGLVTTTAVTLIGELALIPAMVIASDVTVVPGMPLVRGAMCNASGVWSAAQPRMSGPSPGSDALSLAR